MSSSLFFVPLHPFNSSILANKCLIDFHLRHQLQRVIHFTEWPTTRHSFHSQDWKPFKCDMKHLHAVSECIKVLGGRQERKIVPFLFCPRECETDAVRL